MKNLRKLATLALSSALLAAPALTAAKPYDTYSSGRSGYDDRSNRGSVLDFDDNRGRDNHGRDGLDGYNRYDSGRRGDDDRDRDDNRRVLQFRTFLSGNQEVPPVRTRGFGIAQFRLTGRTLEFRIVVRDLTSRLTAAHFHLGSRGVDGPVIQGITFYGNRADGVWHLTRQDLRDILNGRVYVNVHTELYPDGEVRGQLLPLGMTYGGGY